VSAAQALQKLRSLPPQKVATGLPRLDDLLSHGLITRNATVQNNEAKGFTCGHVADIYGPPGSGKTAFWYIKTLIDIATQWLTP
jgi:RecA/RadA recombinase